MSEFRVVCKEPGANSTCLHAEIDQGVLKAVGKLVFWINPGVKVNECIWTNVSQVCCKEENQPIFLIVMR